MDFLGLILVGVAFQFVAYSPRSVIFAPKINNKKKLDMTKEPL
jgi:hypothetical protein